MDVDRVAVRCLEDREGDLHGDLALEVRLAGQDEGILSEEDTDRLRLREAVAV